MYISFKEKVPLPDFLIRTVNAQLQLEAGDLAGTIKGITKRQDVLGMPLTFTFSGENMKEIRFLTLNGSLDHIIPSRSTDTVNARVQGPAVPKMSLSDETVLPVALNNTDAQGTLDDYTVHLTSDLD